MSAAEEPTISKSARKRANKKARENTEQEEEEVAPPAPAPKAKPKAKAEPKIEAAPPAAPKAEAKAKPKAKPKQEPEPPAAQPKPEAKPKKAEPKPAATKAKAQPKKKEEVAPPKEEKKEPEVDTWVQFDDGSGGGWEEATGLTKKQQKQKDKKEMEKAQQIQMKASGVATSKVAAGQYVPGMATQQDVMNAAKTDAKGKAVSQAAVAVVSAAAAASKDKEPEKVPDINSATATVKIPDNKIGWVIGPKGATIAMLKEKTGVKTIDTQGGVCTIVGEKEAVGLAEHAVKELIEKGFTSLAFENFQEHGVMVHPSVIPIIVGEKGCVIQEIKKQAKCEVGIPSNLPKNAIEGSKKYKVTLSGSSASVEQGKEIIQSIVDYGYHPATHPDFMHKEVEVAEYQYKYLIGTKGSEMRHIQNSFHVKVNIPRAHSAIQNVVVVGCEQDVDRALKHIEKVLWNAEQPKGRGAQESSIDPWAGEEEVEDWMSPYLYKRK
jgi:rRNA processing protein Krr1/Pno1